jgi:hypothetical protein
VDLVKLGVLDQILTKIYEKNNADLDMDMMKDTFASETSLDSVGLGSPVVKSPSGFNEIHCKHIPPTTSANLLSTAGSKFENKFRGNTVVYATNNGLKRLKTASSRNGVGYGTGSTKSRWK